MKIGCFQNRFDWRSLGENFENSEMELKKKLTGEHDDS
jgi:hypothetical protein